MAQQQELELWRYLRSQRRLAARLIEGSSLEEVAPDFLETVAGLLRWEAGALWEVPAEAEVLRFVEGWSRQGLDVQPLWRQSRELRFHRGEGLPGHAWAEGQIAVARDFSTSPRYPRRERAAALGLDAALAIPIPIGSPDGVRAVAEFHTSSFSTQSDELMVVLAGFADVMHRPVAEARVPSLACLPAPARRERG